jgi:hypothetical protein
VSYDLYCYRSATGVPDASEAEALIEAINATEEAGSFNTQTSATMEKITAALLKQNPRLEPFKFDYREIAESQKISEAEARRRFQHVELNPPEGDLAIQLTVHDDYVFVSFPYWYKGGNASELFSQCLEYLRVIRQAAGFFVYDPQLGAAFDPERTGVSDGQRCYENTVNNLPKILAQRSVKKRRWWKLW